MVGVPGRSRACWTCRRRKLGCDQLRPSCRQCIRSGLKCGGYDRRLIFVSSTQANVSDDRGVFSARPYSRANSSYAPGQPQSLTQAVAALPSFLSQSLESTAAELKYISMYWDYLLPNGGQQFTSRAITYSTTGWTQIVQELSQRDESVRRGLLVNALALVGQRTGQPCVVAKAWSMHTTALLALHRSLLEAIQHGISINEELLMKSALFASFELLQVTDQRHLGLHSLRWLQHSSGQKAIILAGGPNSFVEGHAHRLFADSRLHLTYPEIYRRKRSAFASSEWKSVPWSRSGKNIKDELVDILLEIPGLLEDFDNFIRHQQGEQEQRMTMRENLLKNCHVCDTHLRTWLAVWGEAAITFAEEQIIPSTFPSASQSSDDFAICHLSMIYWTTCNLLYQIISCLGSIIDERTDPWLYCHKILLMVSVFQRADMGAMLLNFVGFPIGVVVDFLLRQEERLEPRSEIMKLLLQKIFRNEHGGNQIYAFMETWPWMNTRKIKMIMRRARARSR